MHSAFANFLKIVSAECRNDHSVSVRSPVYAIRTKLFAESAAELCARVFAVEIRNETGADLGRTHCFALVSVGAIAESLVVHYLHHFQHASLTFGCTLWQR
jgi:hypothetical protein